MTSGRLLCSTRATGSSTEPAIRTHLLRRLHRSSAQVPRRTLRSCWLESDRYRSARQAEQALEESRRGPLVDFPISILAADGPERTIAWNSAAPHSADAPIPDCRLPAHERLNYNRRGGEGGLVAPLDFKSSVTLLERWVGSIPMRLRQLHLMASDSVRGTRRSPAETAAQEPCRSG